MIFLRYVNHHRIEEYSAKGWVMSDDLGGTPHGQYSVLMMIDANEEGEPDEHDARSAGHAEAE